jgi:hypothetical protein
MVLLILITALVVVAIAATLVVSFRDGYRRSPLVGARTLEP